MSEKDLDIAIEKCKRIMEFDTRTLENPESENGYIFEKVYDLLQFLQQFQFATDTNPTCTENVPVDDCISRQAAIETVRKAQSIGQAHRMLLQLTTVDAVEVVRCKDCIRFRPDDDVWGWCTVSGKMRRKDYCSYGVKDGEQHESI